MSLTSGRGPLSTNPAGRFTAPVPPGLGYVEPFPRRVRGVLRGRTVVDSEHVLLVHRPGGAPSWAFPAAAVAGVDAVADPDAPGHVQVAWDAVEEWYEEEERVVMHPRNPYHRVECVRTSRRLHVEVSGTVLVDTTDTLGVYETALEPRLYVDRAHVRDELLVPSETATFCRYKGHASFWHAQIGGTRVEDVAWSYDGPYAESAALAGMLCFDPSRATVTTDLPTPAVP